MRIVALAMALTSALAWADLIIPPEAACTNQKEGSACRAEFSEGVCTKAKCTRSDYSDGPPPKPKVVDCLKCVAPADAGTPPTRKKKK